MKTMTFQARELKEALAKVRQHLGPDALILSTREVAPLFGIGKSMLEVTASVPEETIPIAEERVQNPRAAAGAYASAGIKQDGRASTTPPTPGATPPANSGLGGASTSAPPPSTSVSPSPLR